MKTKPTKAELKEIKIAKEARLRQAITLLDNGNLNSRQRRRERIIKDKLIEELKH